MINITLPDDLAKRLEEIAEHENRPVEEIVASMVEQYRPQQHTQEESDAAFEAIFGIFHDDVTDMSTIVRETLHKHFQEKYGDPD